MKRVIVAGKLNVDTFFYVDELEVEGNNVASIMKVDLGGKAGNVAVGLRRLGIQVVVTGCVGNDDLGRFVRERLEDAGIDVILVGDSYGMVKLGYQTTLPVTMEEMLIATKAVSRAIKNSFLVADMPFLSYQTGAEEAIRNAGKFLNSERR